MIFTRVAASSGVSRLAVTSGLTAALALGVAAALLGFGSGEVSRGPIAVVVPGVAEPREELVGNVRFVSAFEAPERLLPDSIPPTEPSHLLFFQGRGASPTGDGGALILDGADGVLHVDARLRVHRIRAEVDGRQLSSVAPGPDGAIWLVAGDGEVLLVDERGAVISNLPGPFEYSQVDSDSEGTAWLVRSPDQFAFRPAFGSTPLLARLDAEGEADMTIGSGVIPPDFLLTYMASSGHIAVADSVIYYAPFIRDEIVALSTTGDTLWITERGLPHAVDEPRLEVVDGDAAIDYAPVNLGIAIGPDDRLYVLSVPGFTTSEGRIDVVDAATGHLVRSAIVDTPSPTLAADSTGRVYLLDPFRLLTGVPEKERVPFKHFELELLTGGTMTSQDLVGKVVLVNFWASWCGPCRVEMPALDALSKGITDERFAFITMNEDINPHNALLFMQEYDFEFPVLLGRGDLKRDYHYIGLPFTVLLDADGRVVNRWIGFAGEEQVQLIRALVVAELARGEGNQTGQGAQLREGHEGH